MRQPFPRRWLWRMGMDPRQPLAAITPDVLAQRMPAAEAPALPRIPPELRSEAPDANGIRQGLVAHVRRLIAEGAYDTPACWAAAEERLLESALRDR